ncbi:MAG: AbiV family abortive infection protein [Algoriphagus aquaeductus]|uniref:AbiV family abortive infection protein n=1 Tax=Algoriphagus aquaeductus TaxID=475299 RepID=UPI0038793C55
MKTEKAYKEDENVPKPSQEKLWELIQSCWENVIDLIQDSEILFNRSKYPRAYALAYTALEELGKYLIVCDYYNGLVSKEEFEKAFHNHGMKPGYLFNKVVMSEDFPDKIIYDEKRFQSYFQERNNAMYVRWDKKNEAILLPKKHVNKEFAEMMIAKVKRQVESIVHAIELTGRIGSKGLYK